MTMFQRITKRDSQAKLAEAAAQYQALLTEAVEIAKRKAQAKSPVVREILETGIVEGLAANLNAKAAAVCYQASKFKCSWHTLIPWQDLMHTSAEEEADSMIDTVETNVHMTETNSWPPLPSERTKPKART
jgi:hypothetical protein